MQQCARAGARVRLVVVPIESVFVKTSREAPGVAGNRLGQYWAPTE